MDCEVNRLPKYTRSIAVGTSRYIIESDDYYLTGIPDEFDPDLCRIFRALVEPDDIVVDVGANLGLTSILFSQLSSRVFAFEPSPSTYELAVRNLAANDVSNVEVFNLALGIEHSAATIRFNPLDRAGAFISAESFESEHVSEEIQIIRFDDFVTGMDIYPSVIKIDTEGFDLDVVMGAKEYLRERQPIVIVELNHFTLNVFQRVSVPVYFDQLRAVFPFLYALDDDGTDLRNLYDDSDAYEVMYGHIVHGKFSNIFGGFSDDLGRRLDQVTKDSAAIVSQGPIEQPCGSIRVIDPPKAILPSSTIELVVEVENRNSDAWFSYGKNPVHLCYHIYDPRGEVVVFDGIRTKFSAPSLQPNSSIKQKMFLSTPDVCGTFRFTITLVQEGVMWFEESDFDTCEVEITVSPSI